MEVVSVDDQQQQNKQKCVTSIADYTTAQIHSQRTSITAGGGTGGGNSGDMSRFYSSSDSEDDNIKLTSSQSVVSVNTKQAQKTSQLSSHIDELVIVRGVPGHPAHPVTHQMIAIVQLESLGL